MLTNNTNRRTPYMIQWILNVQKQLDKDTVLELAYTGNSAHKLELFRVWNTPVNRTGPNDSRSLLQRSPFPGYGQIYTVDSQGNSDYEGLSLKGTRRFAKGLTYLSACTWSKAMDQGSAIRNNTADNQFAPITTTSIANTRCRSSTPGGAGLRPSFMNCPSEKESASPAAASPTKSWVDGRLAAS